MNRRSPVAEFPPAVRGFRDRRVVRTGPLVYTAVMFRLRGFRFLRILLVMSLALSPVLSAAGMQHTGMASHDQHQASGSMNDHHAASAKEPGQAACSAHDACGGQCCVACTHCATGVTFTSLLSSPHQPIQAPIVPILDLAYRSSVQDRPPLV